MRHWKFRNRRKDEAGVDMTPMLDIVFIMLIFFIVTAVFLDESGLDFSQQPDSNAPPTDSFTIQVFVDAKNRVSVDRVPTRLSAVPLRVERLLSEKPEASVLILADRQAHLDPIVQIKDQMNMAGRQSQLKIIR